MKRVLDVVGAVMLLLVIWPVLAAVAVVVLGSLGKPVLFRQVRPGKGGRLFTMYKFRTMHTAGDERERKMSDSQRVTRAGRWLRSTSLDELPEIVNVLKGEMSFVGPRPLLVEYLALYDSEQARRHEVRPGITGLAQVRGRNELTWEEKFELDVRYVDSCSFRLDVVIMVDTVSKVIWREGITPGGDSSVEGFKGR